MGVPVATWTGQQIVTVVSRYSGLAGDTVSRGAVLDHINLGLWEISNETPWRWNEAITQNIAVVSGVADYSLTATANGFSSSVVFDEVYDVRLETNQRTLDPIDRRVYDRYRRRFQQSSNLPTHYTIYGPTNQGVITLLPTPNAADLMTIRFLTRQTTIADSTASSLAVADKFMPMIILKGCQLVAAWKNPDRVDYWTRLYRAALARSLDQDKNKPDDMPAFIPRVEWEAYRIDYTNPNDLDFYPR